MRKRKPTPEEKIIEDLLNSKAQKIISRQNNRIWDERQRERLKPFREPTIENHDKEKEDNSPIHG